MSKPSKDPLGDRMKAYEWAESHRRFEPNAVVVVRLDGRGFSKFTRGMDKPFDERMSKAMIEAATIVMRAAKSRLAYTQSDEITLVLEPSSDEDSIFFHGKKQKIVSVLAGLCSSAFIHAVMAGETDFPMYAGRMPHFDCRVFEVPESYEAANAVLWRVRDAERNAVSMATRAHYAPPEMEHKSVVAMKEMLWQKGVDFRALPSIFRQGALLTRRVTWRSGQAGLQTQRTSIDVAEPPERIDFAWVYKAVFDRDPEREKDAG